MSTTVHTRVGALVPLWPQNRFLQPSPAWLCLTNTRRARGSPGWDRCRGLRTSASGRSLPLPGTECLSECLCSCLAGSVLGSFDTWAHCPLQRGVRGSLGCLQALCPVWRLRKAFSDGGRNWADATPLEEVGTTVLKGSQNGAHRTGGGHSRPVWL